MKMHEMAGASRGEDEIQRLDFVLEHLRQLRAIAPSPEDIQYFLQIAAADDEIDVGMYVVRKTVCPSDDHVRYSSAVESTEKSHKQIGPDRLRWFIHSVLRRLFLVTHSRCAAMGSFDKRMQRLFPF
jgi:hypothetical protein